MGFLELDLFFFTWVTFLILFFLLARYGWGPIMGALRSREERIQEDLTTAEEEREKAEHLLEERKKALEEAHSEAREIIEDARDKGEQTREEIVTEAQEKAESLRSTAEKEIEAEWKQAFEEVEGEIGHLSVLLARRILEREVDEDAHERMVEEFIQELDSDTVQPGSGAEEVSLR